MRLEYRILWLDDQIDAFIEDEHIEDLKQYLIDEGFEPEINTVSNHKEFFSKLDNDYDLILTDYHMDDLNGDEVVRRIRGNEYSIFTEILFYSARADLVDAAKIKIDRISFLETAGKGDHEELVIEKVKELIGLTIKKFHDIVVMRGMIMNETSELDAMQIEILKNYIENREPTDYQAMKVAILQAIETQFTQKLDLIKRNWKSRDNGFKKLMKDNFVFSSTYKIMTMSEILNELNIEDFSNEYKEEIINIRNKFAHAKLEIKKGENGRVLKKYFKYRDDGIEFNDELCRTIRVNIKKHKNNLEKLKSKIDSPEE